MSRVNFSYTVNPDAENRPHKLKVLRILSRLARQQGFGVNWATNPGEEGDPPYVDLWVSVPNDRVESWLMSIGEVYDLKEGVVCEDHLQKAGIHYMTMRYEGSGIVVDLAKELADWEIENPIPGSLPLHHENEVRE